MIQEPDHDADWPWTLYFNGVPMPKWANCWNLCDFSAALKESSENQPSQVERSDWCRIADKMDLAHSIESEEPDTFRVCCLELLAFLFRHKARVFETVSPYAAEAQTTAEKLVDGLRDGAVRMYELTSHHTFASWSVGYDSDLNALNEAIRRFQLPTGNPNRLDLPHIRTKQLDIVQRTRSLRSELIGLLTVHQQPKEIRRFIHELPTI